MVVTDSIESACVRRPLPLNGRFIHTAQQDVQFAIRHAIVLTPVLGGGLVVSSGQHEVSIQSSRFQEADW